MFQSIREITLAVNTYAIALWFTAWTCDEVLSVNQPISITKQFQTKTLRITKSFQKTGRHFLQEVPSPWAFSFGNKDWSVTASPFRELIEDMLQDVKTLAEKVARLRSAAESDIAAIDEGKQDVINFAAEVTAVAANVTLLCASLIRGDFQSD